jgi:hypothetical protein
MKVYTPHNQSGVVLLLALLIVSVVLGSAGILSNLVIRSIQQTRLIDQSMQAFYGAESGAERALYQVRRREAIPDCAALTLGSVCQANGTCSLNPDVACITATNGTLALGSGWKANASNEMSTEVLLKKGGSFQIDLFNPYQASAANINQVVLANDVPNLSLYSEFTNVTNILNVGLSNCQSQPPVFKGFIQTPAAIGSLDGKSILAQCSYSFRLNYPLDSSGEQSLISITVFNQDSNTQLPIPSRLTITTSALFGKSYQSLTIKTPVRPPVSGLYDFVLFSEQPLVKQ